MALARCARRRFSFYRDAISTIYWALSTLTQNSMNLKRWGYPVRLHWQRCMQFASGKLIQGVSVFPEAYRRANLPRMAWLFSRKPLQPFLKLAYLFFAKNRHVISNLFGPVALRLVKTRSRVSQK